VSIVIAAVVSPAAVGQDALGSIDNCLRRLDPQIDIGYEQVAARCPELTHRLEGSDWSAWLPPGWKDSNNDLSSASLRELRGLVARELALQPLRRAPDPAMLRPILADLESNGEAKGGWLARIAAWMTDTLDRQSPSPDDGWYGRTLSGLRPSRTVLKLISYACLASIVMLAGAIVARELRLAGAFSGFRRMARVRSAARPAPLSNENTWAEIQQAPLSERPRLLLELIASRLIEQHRLPPSGGLTVRELTQAAIFSQAEHRTLLADLATAAELVRFSAQRLQEAGVESALERGRSLLQHLQ
jgi:hypothetical protein